jgi:hypothetical protein
MEDYSTAAKKYGTVIFDDVEYALCQHAYISDCGTKYFASAMDADGNDYKVTWRTITNDDGELDEDGGNHCDWDDPISVK